VGYDSLMHGFEYREISSKDEKQRNFSGNSFISGCTEYTFNIFEELDDATFLEVDNVSSSQKSLNSCLNADCDFGLCTFIIDMPLRFDWGEAIHYIGCFTTH
jgi:outer membrane translocation and assembly module TamA